MKRVISVCLVLIMLLCTVPALAISSSAASAAPEQGLNATFWGSLADDGESGHYDSYKNIMGPGVTSYDKSIDQLLKVSKKMGSVTGCTEFAQGTNGTAYQAATGWAHNDINEYMVHWTGTITATTAGTYKFVINKLDDCVVIFVDGKKVLERWGNDGYIDNGTLVETDYSFTMAAGETKSFEMWFLDILGGELLECTARLNGGDAKSFSELGLSFTTNADYYRAVIKYDEHDDINKYLDFGFGSDNTQMSDSTASNGSPADNAGNNKYSDATLASIKSEMINAGSCVVPNYESESIHMGNQFGLINDDYLIEYTGFVTPSVTGEYRFGTAKVDNCLAVQITDPDTNTTTTVYDFWAKKIWNDNSVTYSGNTINLTAGKSYGIHVVFLEMDGGECIESRIKINGVETTMNGSGLIFSTAAYAAGKAPSYKPLVSIKSEWSYMTATANADAAPSGWNTALVGTWAKANAPFGNRALGSTNAWATSDQNGGDGTQENAYIWLAKQFTVTDIDEFDGFALMSEIFFDDDIKLYVNGTLVFSNYDSDNGYDSYKLAFNAKDLLVEGTNIIAASLHQRGGGYEFDLGLYATAANTASYLPMAVSVDTADELINYINVANAASAKDGNKTRLCTLDITADINLAGKAWTPLTRYIGTINGNNHTLSGIKFVTSATSGNFGLIVNDLANNNANGTVKNLTVKDSVIIASATSGNVGGIAGLVDRGRVIGCTADNVTVIGNANVGGIAGQAVWQSDGDYVLVQDCTVKNSTLKASALVGGIVAIADSDAIVKLGTATVTNNKIAATVKFDSFVAQSTRDPEKEAASAATGTTENFVASITDGAAQNYDGNTATAGITIKTSANVNAASAVKVNGTAIPASKYSVKNNELVLKKSYLDTLGVGTYTVLIESPLGNTQATVTVTAPPPPTGDAAMVIALIAVLSLGITAVAVDKSRRKSCGK